MANTVTPKLSNIVVNLGSPNYEYAGAPIKPTTLEDINNHNLYGIDYSYIGESVKPKEVVSTTIKNDVDYSYTGETVKGTDIKPLYTDVEEISDEKALKTEPDIRVFDEDPFYIGPPPSEAALETGTRVVASAANAAISLVKGLVSFGEALVDTGALINGAKETVRTLSSDIGSFLYSKIHKQKWDGFKETKSLWTDKIMPQIGRNYTDEIFDKFYDTKVGKAINDKAYSPFKDGGVVCDVCEGIGYYSGIVAISAVTAGAGSAVTISTESAHGIVMGAAAIGRNTQNSYNNLSEEEKKSSKSIGKVVGTSVVTGVAEGAIFTTGVKTGVKAGNVISSTKAAPIVSKVAKAGTQAVVKSFIPITKETAEHVAYGTKWDAKEVGRNVIGVFGAEAVGGVVENAVTNKLTDKAFDALAKVYENAPNGAMGDVIASVDQEAVAAFENVMNDSIIYAATEWSEGATAAVIVEPAA